MDDIQSWWEVPSIAHFCSLFRAAFNLLDFDIEELEEALLTDGAEDAGSSLLQELIVRLLCGCLGNKNNDISTFNYQMFLRRLFRQKCQECGRHNPFNTDMDFQFLPLRTKVLILHALCDFRLDAEDVQDLLKNLDSDSLRIVPLGYDQNQSAYWYFYGTRLYREDYTRVQKKKGKEKQRRKSKEDKRRKKRTKSPPPEESDTEELGSGTWQVVCFTERDWDKVTQVLRDSTSKAERALYHTLADDFMPEIPRLFAEKERLQRKRLLEFQPRRQSSRIEKLKQLKVEEKSTIKEEDEEEALRLAVDDPAKSSICGENRAARAAARSHSRTGSDGGSSQESRAPTTDSRSTRGGHKPVGRQTNNSLASATGPIVIQGAQRKLRSSQVFQQTQEDLQTGMYKILEHIKGHEDAWPFIDPVEEEYAPRYYTIVNKPMDLQRMEDKLDEGEYLSFADFKADFQLIVDNCRKYNGTENEYTEMVANLDEAFQLAVDRYLESDPSTDEEVTVKFPTPTPENQPPQKHRHRVAKLKGERSIPDSMPSPASPPTPLSATSSPYSREVKEERDMAPRGRKDSKHNRDTMQERQEARDVKRERAVVREKQDVRDFKHERDTGREKQDVRDLKRQREALRARRDARDLKTKRDATRDARELKQERDQLRERREAKVKKDEREELRERRERKRERDDVLRARRDAKRAKDTMEEGNTEESRPSTKDDAESYKQKQPVGKRKKVEVIKSTAAIEALELATEQTLKDINKWLDDTPRFSEFSSASNSPSHFISAEEYEVIDTKMEAEYRSKLDPPARNNNKEAKRRPVRDPAKLQQRRREIQRTIERLQPGKSKGNLIANIKAKQQEGEEGGKVKENRNSLVTTSHETGPQLSLGTVLASDVMGFDVGKASHNFDAQGRTEPKSDEEVSQSSPATSPPSPEPLRAEPSPEEKNQEEEVPAKGVTAKKPAGSAKPEPNHSAWFKAFGAPKPPTVVKRKPEPTVELTKEVKRVDRPTLTVRPCVVNRVDTSEAFQDTPRSAVDTKSPGEMFTPPRSQEPFSPQQPSRQRRVSTGSSVSERSSFSQDLMDPDSSSPRLMLDERLGGYPSAPYPSPLHRSPMAASPVMASPRQTDEAKHPSYPPPNGTIRVGFYQDTSSFQKSPDKSLSPREQIAPPPPTYTPRMYPSPHDPGGFLPYPQATPPPLYDPPYGMMQYYDTSKPLTDQYQAARTQAATPTSASYTNTAQKGFAQKSPSTVIPVKKRMYTEMEEPMEPMQGRYQVQPMGGDRMGMGLSNQPMASERMAMGLSTQPMGAERLSMGLTGQPMGAERMSMGLPAQPMVGDRMPMGLSAQPMGGERMSMSLSSQPMTGERMSMGLSSVNGMQQSDQGAMSQMKDRIGYNHTSSAPPSRLHQPNMNVPLNAVEKNTTSMGLPQYSFPPMDLKDSMQQPTGVPQAVTSESPNRVHHTAMAAVGGYRGPFSPAPPSTLDMRGNLANLTHIVDRYPSDERLLQPSAYYGDKTVFGQNANAALQQSMPSSMFHQSPAVMTMAYNRDAPYNMMTGKPADMQSQYGRNVADLGAMLPNKPSSPLNMQQVYNRPDLSSMLQNKPSSQAGYNRSVAELSMMPTRSTPPVDMQGGYNPTPDLATLMSGKGGTYGRPQMHDYPGAPTKQAEAPPPAKPARKRKAKQAPAREEGFQQYAKQVDQSPMTLKTPSVVPGSAFNFGPAPPALGPAPPALGIYGDKDSYPGFLEEYRGGGYYMPEAGRDKVAQSSPSPFPFLSHPQPRPPSYPLAQAFMNHHQPLMDSAGYQQYFQRQEELLRHSSNPMVIHQGLLPPTSYPPGYPPGLGMRQPYDRPAWL